MHLVCFILNSNQNAKEGIEGANDLPDEYKITMVESLADGSIISKCINL